MLNQRSWRPVPLLWIIIGFWLLASFWYTISESYLLTDDGLWQAEDGIGDLTNGTTYGSRFLSPDRPLILYAFYETENAKRNLEFFLKHGIDEDADYIFILNGQTTVEGDIPQRPNIQLVHRENVCYDLGAYGEVLRNNDLWKKYTRFITLNASIRGPFVPVWSKERWTDLFLERITEKTKLVGTTFNCNPRPHVQSMLWATDDVGMAIMLDGNAGVDDNGQPRDSPSGYSQCFESMGQAVGAEIGTTGLIMSKGYLVDVLEAAFHSVSDFVADCQKNRHEDPNFEGNYFGLSIHPYDVVFIKANRNINPLSLQLYTEWHDKLVEIEAAQKLPGVETGEAINGGQ